MKICSHCGNEVEDEAIICPKCGCEIDGEKTNIKSVNPSGLRVAAKVFAIIGTIASVAFYFIPLLWCIPMTISLSNKIRDGEKISAGFKVCILLFVNTLAGILLFCDNDK